MPRHIIIIGAGLGGPCLALCLARNGIRSTIYELRPTPSLSGGSISLSANGLKILDKYCGILPQLRRAGYSYRSFEVYTDDGEKLGKIQVGDKEDKGGGSGYSALRIMRSEVQRVLVEACKESGFVDVRYGMKVKEVQEGEEGVKVLFEDGTEDQGDLLVGADGIHSQIRDYVLGPKDKVSPIYDGICIVNGFVPLQDLSLPLDFSLPAFLFSQSGMLMTIPIDPQAQTLAWGINITLPDPTTKSSRTEWAAVLEQSGEAARMAKAEYKGMDMQPFRSILDNAKDEEVKIWSTYSIGEIKRWSSMGGRVVLMGDAAHGMPPNGLGSALAFEDAATLARVVSENKPDTTSRQESKKEDGLNGVEADGERYKAMMRRYEALRRPRVAKIGYGGKKMRKAKAKSGDWVWWAKKWAFRGFFWWKGGVVVHVADDGFDIDTIDVKV